MLLPVFGCALALRWNKVSQMHATGLFISILLLIVVATVVSYFRMIKRGEDFARSIYDLFFSFYRQEANARK